MKTTSMQFYLGVEKKETLRKISTETGIPMGRLIRDAIDLFLAKRDEKEEPNEVR